MNQRLKNLIFKKLNEDLSEVELISYKDSIWFIDRKKRYWYFEYEKSGTLWWRWDFFPRFFYLFSMERDEFEPLIIEWVEEVLNNKVETSERSILIVSPGVEEVLNNKVETSYTYTDLVRLRVEEVLNNKVETSYPK